MERVVSLAPGATATAVALGAADRLVGVTVHCDVDGIPVVGGWLNPDFDRLDDLDPDVVLTADPLQADVAAAVRDRGYRVVHREPATLDDVLAGFGELGAAMGLPAAGAALESATRERVDRVRAATAAATAGATDRATGRSDRPVVYCEEWGDPPMAAGNWVPDAVRAAGGRYPFRDPGERSGAVDGGTVAAAAPDHVVVHHCGRGDAADVDPAARWELDASVHVLDDDLLNQPSPKLVDGIEALAELLHGVELPERAPRDAGADAGSQPGH